MMKKILFFFLFLLFSAGFAWADNNDWVDGLAKEKSFRRANVREEFIKALDQANFGTQEEEKEGEDELFRKRAEMMEEAEARVAKRLEDELARKNRAIAIEEAFIEGLKTRERKLLFAPPEWGFEPIAKMPSVKEPTNGIEFFSFANTRNALTFYTELESENRETASSSVPARRRRLLFDETLETDFSGSIYHPNLVNFDINLENGLRQAGEKFQAGSNGRLRSSYLNQFHVLSSFLRQKPYAFSLMADKSRGIENREFFERQIVDSKRFAGNFGYRNKFIPIGFSFNNSSKVIDRASRASQNFQDDELSLSLSNESKVYGDSRFDLAQNEFSRTEEGTVDQSGTSRDLNLSNHKFLFSNDKLSLNSGAHYYTLSGTSKSKIFNFNENLDVAHTDNLKTTYTYNFSDRTSSGAKIKDNRLGASLQHKLYESLVSSFNTYYFNSSASQIRQDIYGFSMDEDYTKKLGKIGRLNTGIGFNYSDEKRKTDGSAISVIGEARTLTNGVVTFLDKTGVIASTVVVRNQAGDTTYVLNTDYQLISVGERMQIQRVGTSVAILSGDTVYVNYQAESSPLFRFNTFGQNYRMRFDFFEDLMGVFYRVNKEGHPKAVGSQDAILQKLTDTVAGIDFNYRDLNIEFENEYYDSNLSPYRQNRLKETYLLNLNQKSTLTFQSSQSIVKLLSTRDTQKFFDFTSRYTVALNRNSRFNTRGGFRWQDGRGTDLNDFTFGCGYELSFEKFQMDANYDFNRQLYIGDRLTDHFFYLKAKRTF